MFQQDSSVSGKIITPKRSESSAPADSVQPELNSVQKITQFDQGIAAASKDAMQNQIWQPQPTSRIYNAGNIVKDQLFGINRVVKLGIVIEGQTVKHFKHFRLIQSARKHHEFTVELSHDVMGNPENHHLEDAQNFLGKRITAIFRYKDVTDSAERVFVGVITEVAFAQEQGSLGNIILKGYSPTILLDAAPHTQSFGGAQPVSLSSIADHVLKEGLDKNRFDYRIAAQYGSLSYSSQYEETHYNYLARMAEAYGEQFYYDGEVLHFGELPPQETPVELKYGSNVHDIKVAMRALHVSPTFYGYNSSKDEKLTTGPSSVHHKSDIARRAFGISESTFKTPSLRVAPIKSATSTDISASQKGTAGSRAADVFVTTGTTSVPFLYPGCPANIEMRQQDSNKTSFFTKLMITEVIHEVDARGYYNGHFEAIAADSGFMPRPQFEVPEAKPQVARVVSNTDPQNLGRIQVQFDWQKGADRSEFIRVMTPDAGGSEKMSANRGFMAIPEVGDQVMVGFQHNHPDRPFALGGMFHGKVGAGGGAGNNIKSLSSKSGNIICLNDGAGIEIKDRNGNFVTLSGTGDVTTQVSNDNQEDIGNSHTTNVATRSTVNVGKDESVFTMDNGGNIGLKSNSEIKLETGESSIIMDSEGNITIKGINITIEGSVVKINGSTSVTADNSSGSACSASAINITPGVISINNPNQVDIN